MDIFMYTQKEIEFLKKKDKKLGQAIDKIGIIEREVIPDLFTALIKSIVGQQISAKAATTVWNRIVYKFEEITPAVIAKANVEEIQKCGLSTRKAGYIKGAAEAVLQEKINLNELYSFSDDEVITCLSSLSGIGVWTAEMLLIFSMQRQDVVSWSDLAIQRGMMKLYGLDSLNKETFRKYCKRYSPYGSVASLYLWKLSVDK